MNLPGSPARLLVFVTALVSSTGMALPVSGFPNQTAWVDVQLTRSCAIEKPDTWGRVSPFFLSSMQGLARRRVRKFILVDVRLPEERRSCEHHIGCRRRDDRVPSHDIDRVSMIELRGFRPDLFLRRRRIN